MLSLKIATLDEAPVLLELLHKLYRESAYEKIINWEENSVSSTLRRMLTGKQEEGCVVLLKDGEKTVGLIAVSYILQMFNVNHKTAVEVAYFIEPEYRTPAAHKALLKAYKFWARKVGCHSILMGKIKNMNEVETFTIRRL